MNFPVRIFLVVSLAFGWPGLSVTAKDQTADALFPVEILARPLGEKGRKGLKVIYRPSHSRVEIQNLDETQIQRIQRADNPDTLIRVRTSASSEVDGPSMLGRLELQGPQVLFHPQFPLQPGLTYRVELAGKLFAPSASTVVYAFKLEKEDLLPVTTVEAVYPSAPVLPVNLLKLYVHFSESMSLGDVYSHIQLLDTNGHPLELPFLELGEELWDRDTRRLTLLFDPGRIKRGLKPNLDEGAILEEGRKYTLVVHETMLDAKGRPLRNAFSKTFSVSGHDTVSPNPYNWKLTAPKPATKEPVVVAFPESLDEALLQRVVTIVDKEGEEVSGAVLVSAHETVWSFIPNTPWQTGGYRLQARTILEDLAGNSIGRPFEVESGKPPERYPETKYVYLPFTVE